LVHLLITPSLPVGIGPSKFEFLQYTNFIAFNGSRQITPLWDIVANKRYFSR
jgi:hypothetical protein